MKTIEDFGKNIIPRARICAEAIREEIFDSDNPRQKLAERYEVLRARAMKLGEHTRLDQEHKEWYREDIGYIAAGLNAAKMIIDDSETDIAEAILHLGLATSAIMEINYAIAA